MKVCVTCQESVEGKKAVPIREDRVIRIIRAVKKAVGIAKNNELYVCEKDIAKHTERRKSFEKGMLFASVLAGFLLIVLIGSLIVNGRFDLWAIASALVVGAFVLLLPLFKYAPAIEQGPLMAVAPSGTGAAYGSKTQVEEIGDAGRGRASKKPQSYEAAPAAGGDEGAKRTARKGKEVR